MERGRACTNDVSWLAAAGAAMWALVEHQTGRVAYERGTKAEGLDRDSPVIDCSGWVAELLAVGMQAANRAASRPIFGDRDMAALRTWSDRQIEILEKRNGLVLAGDRIAPESLPPYATIGLQQGGGSWAGNHPRPRGITHVVQVVRRPADHARFVSEAQAMSRPHGLRLLPLADWIERSGDVLRSGTAWAVDPFALGRPAVRP